MDLSGGMLARSAASGRVQADAAQLPLAGGCAAAVVIGDGHDGGRRARHADGH